MPSIGLGLLLHRRRELCNVAENSRFADFADLRQSFGTADHVPPYTVFDVGGNNYRVVVIVRYRGGKMFARWVMTHREYVDWCKRYRKGKRKISATLAGKLAKFFSISPAVFVPG